MKCASDQASIDSSLVWIFFPQRKNIYLNDASNRIIVILVNFPFSILCPGAVNFAFSLYISQPIFDYLRLCVEDASCLSILHKCSSSFCSLVEKKRLNWNPIIILDIGAKRNSYHRLVPLTLSLCVCACCMRLMSVCGVADTNRPTNSSASNKQLTINNCVVSAYPAYRLEKRNFSKFLRSAFHLRWNNVNCSVAPHKSESPKIDVETYLERTI